MSWAGGDLQTGGARPPSTHPGAVLRPRRTSAMQQGLKTAVRVPCALAEKVSGLWPALKELARHCNLACKSDIQVWPWAGALEADRLTAFPCEVSHRVLISVLYLSSHASQAGQWFPPTNFLAACSPCRRVDLRQPLPEFSHLCGKVMNGSHCWSHILKTLCWKVLCATGSWRVGVLQHKGLPCCRTVCERSGSAEDLLASLFF